MMTYHDAVTGALARRDSPLAERIRKEADITVTALPEDTCIRGNCMASGDNAADEACAVEIEAQLDSGNEWAWCAIRVTVKWNGLTGMDFLGCCSYRGKDDFIKNSGYYLDMVNSALDEVTAQAEKIRA